jgi:hypothetical protein
MKRINKNEGIEEPDNMLVEIEEMIEDFMCMDVSEIN